MTLSLAYLFGVGFGSSKKVTQVSSQSSSSVEQLIAVVLSILERSQHTHVLRQLPHVSGTVRQRDKRGSMGAGKLRTITTISTNHLNNILFPKVTIYDNMI